MARALAPPALTTAAMELNRLSDALDNGSSTNLNTEHLDMLLAQLSLSNQEMFTHIALTTIRKYGHMVIDTGGEAVINYSVGTIGAFEGIVEELTAIGCSVANVVTETPCASVRAVITYMIQQFLLPSLVQGATFYVHNDWDQLVDCGSETLLAADDVSRNCRSVVGLLPWFPSTSQQALDFVMPSLSLTQQSLESYQGAVRRLTTAAKTGGQ